MKKKTIRSVSGYIWVGRYRNGLLGYVLPQYMSPNGSEPTSELQKEIICGVNRGRQYYRSDFYRVKITLTPLKNKQGNYIVRRIKSH